MKMRGRIFSTAFLCLFIFAVGCVNQNSRNVNASSGELAPGQLFSLKDLNGSDVHIQNLLTEKKAVLLNFWATWCPPCREEIPALIKLQEKYKDKSFTILGVDIGESRTKASAFVEKAGINYPVVLDSDSNIAEQYGVLGIPTSILVSSDKKILGVYYGFTRQLVEDVEKVLSS